MSLARLLIAVVKAYRTALSPWLGSACRFTPTCSAFSQRALELHGARAGSYLTLRRLARCHPWCEGGIDAVPAQAPRLFSKLLSTQFSESPDACTRRRPLP